MRGIGVGISAHRLHIDFPPLSIHSAPVNFSQSARLHAAILFTAGMSLLSLRPASCAVAPPETADLTPITSVLERGDTIYASTSDGLYEASAKEKKWRKLDTPASMEFGGTYAQSHDPASQFIAYYIPPPPAGGDYKNSVPLFLSKDSGKTWAPVKIPAQYAFYSYFVLSDGSLYASGLFESQGVFESKDSGATWSNISADLPLKEFYFGSLFDDLEHPDRICVRGGRRMMTAVGCFEYDNATGKWSSIDWRRLMSCDDTIYGLGWFLSISTRVSVPATLSNYFTQPFEKSGYKLSVPGVRVETSRSAWTFDAGASKIIPVKVVMLEPHPAATLLEKKDETAYWGIFVQPEDKSSPTGISPKSSQAIYDPAVALTDRDKKAAEVLREPDLRYVYVDTAHPYVRDIDLAKFYDFSKPGHYKVRIYHSDEDVVKWGAIASTEVIDVTITP